MTILHTLRDWVSTPVTCVTLVIATLGSAFLIFACPIGMPANDNTVMWIACSFGAVFFAQLINLGAWAALREGRWTARITIPVALLVIQVVASSIGERLNSMPTTGGPAIASIAGFGTSYVLFLFFRRGDWRIGPLGDSRSVFSLTQLFTAIAFLAASLAIWTWSATDSRGQIALSSESVRLWDIAGGMLVTSILTLALCLLTIPALAIVLGGRTRYVMWLLSVLLLFSVGLVAGSFLGSSFVPAIVPVVFVVVTMWHFYAYRMCGFYFVGLSAPQPPRKFLFFAGVGLALVGVLGSAFTLGDLRVEQAVKRPWMQLGVSPSGVQGSQFTGVSFYRSEIGITRPAVEGLKHQPLLRNIFVQCPASPEQIGWLTELPQLELLMLSGKDKGDPHLKSLYQASHLKRLELNDTTASIAEVKKLQQVLVGCEVRMTNGGKLIVGASANVRKQQVVAP